MVSSVPGCLNNGQRPGSQENHQFFFIAAFKAFLAIETKLLDNPYWKLKKAKFI